MLLSAWLAPTGATLGSLFFSEVMELPPCKLCWYQRIFMFPLPIILFMGLFPFDRRAVRYAMPVAVVGALIAIYHLLLQAGVIPESISPCSEGVSCADIDFQLFGFASIPMLSLFAFGAIIALLVMTQRSSSR
jgi:disulfide bond formation protein DsbB